MHVFENLAAEGEVQAECLERRRKNRLNKSICQAIDLLWHEIEKDRDFMVSKSAYLDLFQRIALTLVKGITQEQAREMAQRDWLYDSQGRDVLNYERFTSSLFELVDLFSDPLLLSQLEEFQDTVNLSKAELRKLSLKQSLAVKHAETYPDDSTCGDVVMDEAAVSILPAKYEPQRVNKLLNRLKNDTWDQNLSFINDARKHGVGVCVIGPPLSGKTTLARHLASLYGLQYVSESSVLESLDEPSSIVDDLRAGKSVKKEIVRPLLLQKVRLLSSAGLGFVLDDINPSEVVAIDFIIRLQLSDSNILKRFKEIKVDPTTGIRYSGAEEKEGLIPLEISDLKQKIRQAKRIDLNLCTSYCLIEIEASQTVQMVSEQAAVKLAGNSSIFPMIPPNVKALHLEMDPSIESFTEQLKWLLYADIDVPENDRYLIPENEPRHLSAWGTICPVKMIQGDPTQAAIFSGNVFLLSSEESRVEFSADPEKYLKNKPIDSSLKNILLISPLTCPVTQSVAEEIAKHYNIRLISAVSILEEHMEDFPTLRDGNTVAVSDVIELICNQLVKESSGFLLIDLPSDSDIITKLKEKNNIHLTHAIVLDDSFKQEGEDNQVSLIEIATGMTVSDTVAAVKRGLDPFEPRIDQVIDGNSIGDYGLYCGVTWIENQRVVPGNESFTTFVNQRKYKFAAEDQLETFKRNVAKYLPTAPIQGPPPVILFLGLSSSGKLTQASRILQASVIDRSSIARDVELKRQIHDQLSVSSIYVEVLENYLNNTKANDQCVILPGLGDLNNHQDIIQDLVSRRLLPQYVLPFSVTREEYVKRKMSKWVYVPPQDEESPAEDAAQADRVAELELEYEKECEMLENSLQTFKELEIHVLPPVDAVGTEIRVSKRVSHALLPTFQQRNSIFCSPEAITVARAQVLLKSGYIRMGQHGIYCPIAYKEQSVETNTNWPVLYRGRLYFPSSPDRQIQFLTSVDQYIDPNASAPEKLPVQVAIIGPKTTLAQNLATKLGLVHITAENAVEWVGDSELSTAEAIELRIRSSECQRLGWVLDGYPNTIQELDLAHAAGIRPDLTLFLDTQCESSRQVVVRLIKTYGNGSVKRINANMSQWTTRNEAECAIRDTYKQIQQHHQAVSSGKPGRIDAIRIDFATMEKYKSPNVDLLCPVELSRGSYYLSQLNDREFTVEFNGFFYWLASQQNYQQFIADPSNYSSSSVDTSMIPVDIAIGSSLFRGNSIAFAFQGYCPVTFRDEDGRLEKGLPYLLVKYRNDVYTFTSELNRHNFLHSPENYIGQKLPEHLPPVLPPPDLSKGPSELERILGSIIKTALGYISEERIKYPGVGYRATSMYHLALWLKANNINALPHIKAKFQQRLAQFEEDCRLTETITSSTSVGTAVKGIRAARDASQKDIVTATERFDTIIRSNALTFHE